MWLFDRRRNVTQVMPLLVLAAAGCVLAGCEEARPRNPDVEIMATPPHTTENSCVSDFRMLVDETPLGESEVEVHTGQTIRVSGSFTINPSAYSGTLTSHLTTVRLLPKGASNDEWDRANRDWKFADRFTMILREEGQEFTVDAPPGDYDARVFVRIKGHLDDVPRFPLIAKGSFRVLPAASD